MTRIWTNWPKYLRPNTGSSWHGAMLQKRLHYSLSRYGREGGSREAGLGSFVPMLWLSPQTSTNESKSKRI